MKDVFFIEEQNAGIGEVLLNDKKWGIVFSFIFGGLAIFLILILLTVSFFGQEILEYLRDGFSE
ncbi:hypothetical protein LSPCS325_25950 [Lysinibacillus sp. CTST325]